MPKVSGQEALKALHRKGFSIRKGKGDHTVVSKPGIPPFTVPLHRELKTGTLQFIIKQSQDFKDRFLKLT